MKAEARLKALGPLGACDIQARARACLQGLWILGDSLQLKELYMF